MNRSLAVTSASPLSLAVTSASPLSLAVTGATGFVGQMLVDQALANGHRVTALTRRPQPPRDGVTWVEGTLDDPAALHRLVDGSAAVLHIAGAVNVPTRAAFAAANITGTANIIAAAQAAGVRRFVHISSLAAREPALSDYGWSKAEAEQLVSASGLEWVIVRPPGVYGPRDADMLELFRMARRGFALLPPPGRGSWIHCADLARLLLTLCAGGPTGTIIEPDDGQPMSHVAMARAIGRAVGRDHVRTLSAPRTLLRLAALADRLVRGDAAKLTPDRARYMAHHDWTVDPAARPDAALWQPMIDSETGFRETAQWYVQQGWISTE